MRRYEFVSGLFLAFIALAQLARFVRQWPIVVAGIEIPVWTSGVAFLVAGSLALWGFRCARASISTGV